MPVTVSTPAVQGTAEKSTNNRPALRLVSTKNMPRETWLDVRRKGIGSSDAAAAVGLNPYQSQLELWMHKTGKGDLLPAVDPDDETSPMYWGTLLEPIVAAHYTKRTGNKVRRVNAVLGHPQIPWMLANIDREVVGAPDVQILECKTAGINGAKLWKDGVPEYIQLQVMHQLAVTGSLKFDISVTPELAARAVTLRRQWAPHRKVWIATSTHDGEEQIILQAHKKLLETFPNLLLILVPRHPERFPDARDMVQKAGMSFTLRSTGEIPSSSTQVVIGDTMGELMLLYGIADLAFVGGSLVERGGHNPLEPAAHAIPVLMGPHTFNFKDICAKLQQADGLITVTDADSVVKEVSTLLTDEDYRLWYGRHAVEVLHQNQGALARLLQLLQPYLPQRSH